jgi:hypothetical protein
MVEFEKAYRDYLVAYTILTTKKTKSKAAEARKALMTMKNLCGDLRKSIQVYKEKI